MIHAKAGARAVSFFVGSSVIAAVMTPPVNGIIIPTVSHLSTLRSQSKICINCAAALLSYRPSRIPSARYCGHDRVQPARSALSSNISSHDARDGHEARPSIRAASRHLEAGGS